VKEAELSMRQRLGASERVILAMQTNLACTYATIGRLEEALQMDRDVYSGRLKLDGEEDKETLIAACNYANSLENLKRFEEAKALVRRTIPVARRILGAGHDHTLRMRNIFVELLYKDPDATLGDLREAVTTIEDSARIARRVFGGSHPLTEGIERRLREARAALRAREAS